MKKRLLVALATLIVFTSLFFAFYNTQGEWGGVDESVVEHYATQAGRPPRDPYINTDRGDLLLLVFLLAGTAGGFVAGYSYRTLLREG